MDNAGGHEPVLFQEAGFLCHLEEAIGQREVATLDTLRSTPRSVRKAQSTDRFPTNRDIRNFLFAGNLRPTAIPAVNIAFFKLPISESSKARIGDLIRTLLHPWAGKWCARWLELSLI